MDHVIGNSRRAVKNLSDSARDIYHRCDSLVIQRIISSNNITSRLRPGLAGNLVDMYRVKRARCGKLRYKTALSKSLSKSAAVAELVGAGVARVEGGALQLRVDARDDWYYAGRAVYNVL